MGRLDLEDCGGDFEDCWEVLVEEHDRYTRLAVRMCRGHYDLVPDLLGVCYEKAVQVEMTWDPTIGSLRAHMWSSLTRYMFKYICNCERHMGRYGAEMVELFEPAGIERTEAIDAKVDVAALKAVLSDQEYWVLSARHSRGYSWQDLADHLPSGPTGQAKVKRLYAQALEHAKEFFNV